MIDIQFDNYLYFPTLRTRAAEMKGLLELDGARKRQIVPLFTLGRWPKALDFMRSADKAAEAMGDLPYFIDLTTDGSHLAEQQKALRDPAQAFQHWRAFVGRNSNAIPVVQTTAGLREVTKQAQELERSTGRLAFRIRDFAVDTPVVISAISAIDSPRNAMVFIDCGYIRDAMAAYVTAVVSTINRLRAEFPELVIAVLSTSFPTSTIPYADMTGKRGSIEILERSLHDRIGGDSVAAYGDHSSVHSVVYDDSPIMRWAARVDFPRELDWYFERRPGDQTADGYASAARAIVKEIPDIGRRDIWGEQMILDAANGSPHARAPGSWISVRVNIHLARQIDFANELRRRDGQDDADNDAYGDDD